jgi:hypothetical protein
MGLRFTTIYVNSSIVDDIVLVQNAPYKINDDHAIPIRHHHTKPEPFNSIPIVKQAKNQPFTTHNITHYGFSSPQ